jgi:CRP-like cAMP-binding protein
VCVSGGEERRSASSTSRTATPVACSVHRCTDTDERAWHAGGRPDSHGPPFPVTRRHSRHPPLNNLILRQLSGRECETLLADATYVDLPDGYEFVRAGDAISSAYFPDTGVISRIGVMTTGHQVAVGAVGCEGMIGAGVLFGMRKWPLSSVVLVRSSGHLLPSNSFRRRFQESVVLQRATLAHLGRQMRELTTTAACNRVHSNRQRLARWLLITTGKAQQQSLPVTHEALAQMVGGPRHAVTVALNDLRARGAIAHLRGRIEILDRGLLIAQACECYAAWMESAGG